MISPLMSRCESGETGRKASRDEWFDPLTGIQRTMLTIQGGAA